MLRQWEMWKQQMKGIMKERIEDLLVVQIKQQIEQTGGNLNDYKFKEENKTVSHYSGMNNLDALVNKSTKLQAIVNTDSEFSNTDSSMNGVHKRPRQPNQRIGVTSKVSSTEKEASKKNIEKGKEFLCD